MKTVFRFVGIAAMAAVFMFAGADSAFAQAECDNATLVTELDAKIRENYTKTNDQAALKVAIDAAKQYLEKFGTCDATKDFADWVRPQVPGWEKRVAFLEIAEWLTPRFKRFDDAVKANNFDEMFAAGGEILQKYPVGQVEPITQFNSINQAVTLGLAGLDASYAKNTKHADAAIRYAKAAADYIKSGGKAASQTKDGKDVFGIFQFSNTREDAVSKLTFAQAQIKFADKNDKKGALAHYYEVTQMPGFFQKRPVVYAAIGDYFREEATKIGTETAELVKQQQAAATDEAKVAFEPQIKAKDALLNGYTERAMDAYSRAYSLVAGTTAEEKKYKDGLLAVLTFLYERRFEKKDGLTTWIAEAVAKPMPNPTSEVQPVADPTPDAAAAPTTTGGSTAVNRP
ncbi:MAG: hypothetical protein QUS14_00535 [Pyrinomonadaceae bacterium]|nr:hypothetical protein [Pyrinomonadaceae bacterium]